MDDLNALRAELSSLDLDDPGTRNQAHALRGKIAALEEGPPWRWPLGLLAMAGRALASFFTVMRVLHL